MRSADLDLHGVRWIAAGTYRVEPVERGGSAAGGTLFIDGRPAGSLVRVARDGFHDVRWMHAPPDAFMVAFVPGGVAADRRRRLR